MKPSRPLSLLAGLLFLLQAGAAHAQTTAPVKTDGKADGWIIEQSPFVLPPYEQLPEEARSAYSKEVVEKIRNQRELELLKIRYMSDGLKIVGFIYKPVKTAGKKLPVLIFNRGGLADETIGPENFRYIYEMHRYASEGFVVLASQYRGAGGSEGKDEIAGADTDDVINLLPLARSLGYADMKRIFMWGFSRGGMMTLQAIRRGVPLRAAVVVGAPTDLTTNLNNPGWVEFARTIYPDFETRKEEHVRNRSAILWAEQINVPLLIISGGADRGVTPPKVMAFAQKLDELGKLYELVIYAKDDHPVSLNAEDRLRRTIDWFKNVRTKSIGQAIGKTVREQGAEAAIRQYYDLKKTKPDVYDFSEPELNTLGYNLLGERRVKEAVEIFKLNATVYPKAFNTYDSLGEAYLAAGERELAIQNYRKSLELNPQNTNATAALKKIEQQK